MGKKLFIIPAGIESAVFFEWVCHGSRERNKTAKKKKYYSNWSAFKSVTVKK